MLALGETCDLPDTVRFGDPILLSVIWYFYLSTLRPRRQRGT